MIFFQKTRLFFKGKAAFLFNQGRFIANHASSLQNTITAALSPAKLLIFARNSGFLRRESKFKPEEFIDTLMFSHHDHSQLSLQDCCNDLAQQHEKSLSKVALHNRLNSRSLDFLKQVLADQMAAELKLKPTNDWRPFCRVVLADSCKFILPELYKSHYPGYGNFKNVSSLMNLQYAFDLKKGNWENLEFTKATQNDQSHSNRTLDSIQKDDLHIRDLGFITQTFLSEVVEKKAYFLNRLPPQWIAVRQDTGERIDWTKLSRELKKKQSSNFETTVILTRGKDSFSCRLIAVAVPEEVAEERIRKAQKRAKSRGVALSDDYKCRCRFSIFITNTDPQMLKSEDVIELYRLRWQIELVFKAWKSLLKIHKVKAVKKERLECQLVSKFIWILLNWKIFRCLDHFIKQTSPGFACSIWKFIKQVRQYGYALRKVATGRLTFEDWCEIFIFPIVKSLLIEPKRGKKASYVIVNDVFRVC